jgi:hypothetical protein
MFREIYLDLLRRPTAFSRFLSVSDIDNVQPTSFALTSGQYLYRAGAAAISFKKNRGKKF